MELVAAFKFTPAISARAKALERNYEDLEKWVKDRGKKLTAMEAALLEKELSQCTFTPQILEVVSDHAESGSDTGRLQGSAGMRCTSRLYEDASRRQESRGLTPPRGKCDCIGCRGRVSAGGRSGGGASTLLPNQRARTPDDRARPLNIQFNDFSSEAARGNLGVRPPMSFDHFIQRSKSSTDARAGNVGRQHVSGVESSRANTPRPAGVHPTSPGHLTSPRNLTFAPSLDNLHLAETPRSPPLAVASISGPPSPTRSPSRPMARKKTIMSRRSRPPILTRVTSANRDDGPAPLRRPAALPGKNFIQYDPDFGDIFALSGLRS